MKLSTIVISAIAIFALQSGQLWSMEEKTKKESSISPGMLRTYNDKVQKFLYQVKNNTIDSENIVSKFNTLTNDIPEEYRKELVQKQLSNSKYFLHQIARINAFSIQKKNFILEKLHKTWQADFTISNSKEKTILHKLVSNPRKDVHLVIRMLIQKYNANVNAQDSSNRTALHIAALATPTPIILDIVTELLNNKADANLKDMSDDTAAHKAARSCQGKKMVSIYRLLAAKTTKDIKNLAGLTFEEVFEDEKTSISDLQFMYYT